MSSYAFKRFAQPGILKKMHPHHLIQLLIPYTSYLQERGFFLSQELHQEIDYEKLTRILMSPTLTMPVAMVEALYFIQETSQEERFEDLCEQARKADIRLEENCTPADVAVQIWLQKPVSLKRLHAETLALKPKSFMYFQARVPRDKAPLLPTKQQKAALEQEMDQWFSKHKRGPGSELMVFPAEDERKTYFLVRHGMPYKREGKIEEGQSATVFYRPEFYDVLIYDCKNQELAVFNKSRSKRERDMYVALFGKYFFGDSHHFTQESKYTLKPLLEQGEDALACGDIPGLERIKLVEIKLQFRGPHNHRQTYRSKDFFASLLDKNALHYGELVLASFSVQFRGANKPRLVKIRVPNIAHFDRKEDAHIIELWLRKRGFVVEPFRQYPSEPVAEAGQYAMA